MFWHSNKPPTLLQDRSCTNDMLVQDSCFINTDRLVTASSWSGPLHRAQHASLCTLASFYNINYCNYRYDSAPVTHLKSLMECVNEITMVCFPFKPLSPSDGETLYLSIKLTCPFYFINSSPVFSKHLETVLQPNTATSFSSRIKPGYYCWAIW